MRARHLAALAAALFLTLGQSVATVIANDMNTCLAAEGLVAEGDESIAACTRYIALAPINGGLLAGALGLAAAYDSRGHARLAKGKLDEAIADFDEAIRLRPRFYLAYFNRGRARLAKGDHDGANNDFAVARRDTEFIATHLSRGKESQTQGNLDAAIADFDLVILLTPEAPAPYTSRGLAWEAKEKKERATADFKASLSKPAADQGASEAQQIARDHLSALSKGDRIPPNTTKTSGDLIAVPLKTVGGTFVVPVEINSAITLDFVIDSGASDVSLPADVVGTLLRTGTLKQSDFIGKRTYVLADGSQSPSRVFIIRSLRIGGNQSTTLRAALPLLQAVCSLVNHFLNTLGLGQSTIRNSNLFYKPAKQSCLSHSTPGESV
jgi:predicted aspartyl protease